MTTSATPRGLLFGTAAESYERFRPGYPDEVVDRTLAFAERSVGSAVEIGAGTGKATRAFASRGIRITALEPDRGMFGVLERETAGMPVTPVHSTFDKYDGPRTDLVYAAAAMHWTDPATRWGRVRDLLAEGGVVAIFGSPMVLADQELRDAVDKARRPFLPDDDYPHDPDSGLAASDAFVDVEHHVLDRTVMVESREYVGYLSTVSAYLQLSLEERQQVVRRIASVLPPQVRLDVSVGLYLGRRT